MEREEQTKKPGESQTVVALFKMCTGTPHCGSGVQAADELLIPTSSSVLMFPFSTQPSPHSPPLISPPLPSLPPTARLSADLSDVGRRDKGSGAARRFSTGSAEAAQPGRGAALAVNQSRQRRA